VLFMNLACAIMGLGLTRGKPRVFFNLTAFAC
jgi:hypothetical protein